MGSSWNHTLALSETGETACEDLALENMIVCPEPLAAAAGAEIFAAGGNAVDAAIAAAFVQGVTNPLMCGVGGTALIQYYDRATHTQVAINGEVEIGSLPVPEHWQGEFLGRSETIGRYILESEANQVGHQSVMVPGFVRACNETLKRYGSGSVSWADVLLPAIELARYGYDIYPYIADFWKLDTGGDVTNARPGYPELAVKLNATSGARNIYLKPDLSAFAVGDRIILSDYAATLQQLADAGGEDFYSGEIAHTAIRDFQSHQGLFSAVDLAEYAALDQDLIHLDYRGYRVSSPGPPASGIQSIEMLKLLERFDLSAITHNSVEYIDLQARIQRASFSDNVALKGMSFESGSAFTRQILSEEHITDWADRISTGDRVEVVGGAIDPGTTHLTAIDADRNVVAFTHSIGSIAGSGVVTPGLGFLWNNFLGHFHPIAGHADSIVQGRKLGGLLPMIVFRNETPYIGIGAPGGSRIITAVTQAIVNVIDFGMDMATAVAVPRFHSEERQLLFLEPELYDTVGGQLARLGNEVESSTYMSRVQAIRINESGNLEAGADPRGGGGVGTFSTPA